MSLLRRKKNKKPPTRLETTAKIVRHGATALTAQRVARQGHKHYKRGRRLFRLGIVAAIGAGVATIAKKIKGDSGPSTAATYTPPATTSSPPSSPEAAATSTSVPQPSNGGAPPAAESVSGDDIPAALEDADVSGDGPDTPEQATEEQKPAS